MSSAEWKPQMPLFGKDFRTIAPDQPGHGRSPMTGTRLRIRDIAEAAVALLDELGIESAHVVGSSMGGAVALWMALRAPERVGKLVLYRVGYRKTEASHAGTREMADPAYWQRLGMHRWLSRLHEAQGGPDAWQTVIGRVSEALDPRDSDHAHELEHLAEVTHPTLLICGDRDPLAPLDALLEMHRTLPNSGLWLLPYASHVTATNTWRSHSFAEEISRFLKRG
jgi:pimeloyl-ACP methyl ester carboxylesterase